MPHRPILRTTKYENLGEKIAKHQRLQWPTYVEGTTAEEELLQFRHPSNCVGQQQQQQEEKGETRDMVSCAYAWLPDPYQYEPLDNNFRAIRLIEILQGPADSIIKCTMHNAMLDADYACLSYMSSFDEQPSNNADCFISVDKKRLHVSKNLWSFLHFARSRYISNLFWINEVCIDSANLQEKNQQVSLIPWIYRSANTTIAWLDNLAEGMGNPDLSMVAEAADTLPGDNEILKASWFSSRTLAIQIFLFHPYWWRLWAAQELVLSRNLLFLTSTNECSLEAIYPLFRGLTSVKLELPDLYHAMLCSPAFNILSNVRNLYLKHDGLPLHYFMQALKFNDCTEPRDRIYGILGLVMHGDGFDVDYSELVPNLIRRAWESFRPRTRWLSKLLFLDLVEAMDVDYTMLPFYLVSRRSFTPASQLQVDSDKVGIVKLEIKEKKGGCFETLTRVQKRLCCCLDAHSCGRSRCCTLSCWRQKYVLRPTGLQPIRMITCWQA